MDYLKRLRELGCLPPDNPVDSDMEAVEAGIGVSLPAEYREFLARCGGWWGDIICPCREPAPFGDSFWNSGFHGAGEVRSLLDSMITPRNMITIGCGHFAKYTCLSIAGIDRGAVYGLDGEFRAYWSDEEFHQRFNAMDEKIRDYLQLRCEDKLPEKPAGYDNLYLLAGGFDEFLSSCRAAG